MIGSLAQKFHKVTGCSYKETHIQEIKWETYLIKVNIIIELFMFGSFISSHVTVIVNLFYNDG